MQYNIIYREKDGSWQYIISYKDINGKWKQKSKQGFPLNREGKRKAKDKALEALKELEQTIGQNVDINTEYENITFKEFSHMFLSHERLYKEGNTLRRYNTSIKAFDSLFDAKIVDIKPLHVQECIDNLIKRELKASTIKLYIRGIKLVFDYAINLNIILLNPVTKLQVPKDKSNSDKKALTVDELDDLLSKIENRKFYIISMIAGKCGLRFGEIMGLTWDDVDFQNKLIKINKQWKVLTNNKYGYGELKSRNSKREVHIPKTVRIELKKYKNECGINKNRRIFNNINNISLSRNLMRNYKKAGYNITVHELRHTYATNLVAGGMDYPSVAKIMGHDVKQTMDTYSHVTKDMINRASKLIDEIF
ncbi:site-specific integrase [Clostridium kluyveri]|uniref:Site-specific integrase n=1 Tax=Clostridium kluyveri TaxID=1534 RepID=A0A1L5F8V9_CLOKL|nr:site-specific integrase [Clostridium kluyveri]APM39448.1 hypothetical protein BS101_12180 [Clostridium kluyveri]